MLCVRAFNRRPGDGSSQLDPGSLEGCHACSGAELSPMAGHTAQGRAAGREAHVMSAAVGLGATVRPGGCGGETGYG